MTFAQPALVRLRSPFRRLAGLAGLVVVLAGLAVALGVPAAAQPFSTLAFSAGPTFDVGRPAYFHSFWRRGYGGEATITTPFYLGTVEGGAALHRYDVRAGGVPRFDAVAVFAGWGLTLRPVSRVGWYNGLRVGTYRMTFDEATFTGVRNESELLVGVQSRIEVSPGRGWTIFGAVSAQQVYTFIRLRHVYAGGGIRYRVRTPGWMEAVLR